LITNQSYWLETYKIARKGLARTFQNVRLFGDMTALENVMTGADSRNKVGLIGSMFGTPTSKKDEIDLTKKQQNY
jgi:branched-chain amino acid transport system ATP-binding protein